MKNVLTLILPLLLSVIFIACISSPSNSKNTSPQEKTRAIGNYTLTNQGAGDYILNSIFPKIEGHWIMRRSVNNKIGNNDYIDVFRGEELILTLNTKNDIITSIEVFCPDFKSTDGLYTGLLLSQIKARIPDYNICYSSTLQAFVLKANEHIFYILSEDSYKGKNIDKTKEEEEFTIQDFDQNTKIEKIVIK